jgi:hypothetical protein
MNCAVFLTDSQMVYNDPICHRRFLQNVLMCVYVLIKN